MCPLAGIESQDGDHEDRPFSTAQGSVGRLSHEIAPEVPLAGVSAMQATDGKRTTKGRS